MEQKDGGCATQWASSNHMLFQIGHAVLLVGLMAPHGRKGLLVLHAILVIG